MCRMLFSSAYIVASSISTLRLSCRSALLPASAITTLGSPRRCSSFTHDLAPLNDSLFVMSYTTIAAAAPR